MGAGAYIDDIDERRPRLLYCDGKGVMAGAVIKAGAWLYAPVLRVLRRSSAG